MNQYSQTVHGSCVALGGKGVLIVGASGSGKSTLALQLMTFGCALVADDRVILTNEASNIIGSCPDPIRGLIEARGIGVLNAQTRTRTSVNLVVDMDQIETARLPERRMTNVLGCQIPLIHKVSSDHFSVGVFQLLKTGWSNR